MTLMQIGGRSELIHCPACGHYWPFSCDSMPRWKHISEHKPEDFGLAPLGEGRKTEEKPLFPEPDEIGGDLVDA